MIGRTRLMRLIRGESGAAAVEFALILPVFLLILFAILQFGLLFSVQSSMANAAREEARRIAMDGGSLNGRDVTASVLDRLAPWPTTFPGGFTVTSSPPAAAPAPDTVYVEIKFNLSKIAFGWMLSTFSDRQISARVASQVR